MAKKYSEKKFESQRIKTFGIGGRKGDSMSSRKKMSPRAQARAEDMGKM